MAAVPAATAGAEIMDNRGITRVISLHTDGTQGNRHSGALEFAGTADNAPSISPNGRFVAFSSEAPSLVNTPAEQLDGNDGADVFVRDRDANADGILDEAGGVTTSLVSRGTPTLLSPLGEQLTPAFWPAITANGRFVAFVSIVQETLRVQVRDRDADANGVFDEPSTDADLSGTLDASELKTKTVTVSVLGDGTAPTGTNAHSFAPAISDNGRIVAFSSWARLSAADTNTCGGTDTPELCSDVYAHDRDADADGIYDEPGAIATTVVSVTPSGVSGNNHSGEQPRTYATKAPGLSADGRYVAFQSLASDLVAGDTNETWDVFVRDRAAGTTQRVSVRSDGAQGWSRSLSPSLSGDGRFVAFQSNASTLVDGDTNGAIDIFVRDRVAGTTTRVNTTTAGAQITGGRTNAIISANGRYVTFQSSNQVFVKDRSTGVTRVVSVSAEGQQGSGTGISNGIILSAVKIGSDGISYGGAPADNGWVTFISKAINLTPDDRNVCQYFAAATRWQLRACADIFVRAPGAGYCLTVPAPRCPFPDQI